VKTGMQWLRIVFAGLLCAGPVTLSTSGEKSLMDQVLDRVVANENGLINRLENYTPLVETYIQTLKPDRDLGAVPMSDDYFFGRLRFSRDANYATEGGGPASEEKLLDLFKEFYGRSYHPDGFARMMVLDPDSFDRENYDFEFVRREFLGEIRTLVFEVVPRMQDRPRRFIGRIWVEDEEYNIVRYNGIYTSRSAGNLHFDSWRLNMNSDFWYPAYVYTEESDFRRNGQLKRKLKGQTRIWGYDIKRNTTEEEFSKIMLESSQANDSSDKPGHVSPVEDLRAWEREAEDNVLQRLEKGGIIAPSGAVDKVLETVTANLEVTNSLNIEPAIRCRVLLTTPLESFTVGHTIVISRGLIDVLPDEASLAMILAHEMGHILMGHQLDTKYAFSDQMLVGDKQAMDQFFFKRIPDEEAEADDKAVMLLSNSPYKDQIGNAGLFLKALSSRADTLPALIRSHFGNRMASRGKLVRMNRLTESAPELYETALNQTAALPLGSRVKLDPWTARIELMSGNQVVLLSVREKMPFEVTPLMPHLVRQNPGKGGTVGTRPKATGGKTATGQLR
jgi:hypothetical protein